MGEERGGETKKIVAPGLREIQFQREPSHHTGPHACMHAWRRNKKGRKRKEDDMPRAWVTRLPELAREGEETQGEKASC